MPKKKGKVTSKQQINLEGEIDFQKTLEKLRSSNIKIRPSGGGRNGLSFDSGNAIFGISDLPGAKFNITPYGKIQITSPDPTKFGECESAVTKYLVGSNGEEDPILWDTGKSEVVIDDPNLHIRVPPKYSEHELKEFIDSKSEIPWNRNRNKDDPSFERERLIEFYTNAKSDLLEDLEKINAILEGLLKNEKTAIYVEPPTYGVRLKHSQVVFIGKGWSEDEIHETLNAFTANNPAACPEFLQELITKYGAEVIEFEPYWYFFDNGEAKENLKLLETIRA